MVRTTSQGTGGKKDQPSASSTWQKIPEKEKKAKPQKSTVVDYNDNQKKGGNRNAGGPRGDGTFQKREPWKGQGPPRVPSTRPRGDRDGRPTRFNDKVDGDTVLRTRSEKEKQDLEEKKKRENWTGAIRASGGISGSVWGKGSGKTFADIIKSQPDPQDTQDEGGLEEANGVEDEWGSPNEPQEGGEEEAEEEEPEHQVEQEDQQDEATEENGTEPTDKVVAQPTEDSGREVGTWGTTTAPNGANPQWNSWGTAHKVDEAPLWHQKEVDSGNKNSDRWADEPIDEEEDTTTSQPQASTTTTQPPKYQPLSHANTAPTPITTTTTTTTSTLEEPPSPTSDPRPALTENIYVPHSFQPLVDDTIVFEAPSEEPTPNTTASILSGVEGAAPQPSIQQPPSPPQQEDRTLAHTIGFEPEEQAATPQARSLDQPFSATVGSTSHEQTHPTRSVWGGMKQAESVVPNAQQNTQRQPQHTQQTQLPQPHRQAAAPQAGLQQNQAPQPPQNGPRAPVPHNPPTQFISPPVHHQQGPPHAPVPHFVAQQRQNDQPQQGQHPQNAPQPQQGQQQPEGNAPQPATMQPPFSPIPPGIVMGGFPPQLSNAAILPPPPPPPPPPMAVDQNNQPQQRIAMIPPPQQQDQQPQQQSTVYTQAAAPSYVQLPAYPGGYDQQYGWHATTMAMSPGNEFENGTFPPNYPPPQAQNTQPNKQTQAGFRPAYTPNPQTAQSYPPQTYNYAVHPQWMYTTYPTAQNFGQIPQQQQAPAPPPTTDQQPQAFTSAPNPPKYQQQPNVAHNNQQQYRAYTQIQNKNTAPAGVKNYTQQRGNFNRGGNQPDNRDRNNNPHSYRYDAQQQQQQQPQYSTQYQQQPPQGYFYSQGSTQN